MDTLLTSKWECGVCGTALHLFVTEDHYLAVKGLNDLPSICTDGKPHQPKLTESEIANV